jgi:uncharacterized coiled-coil DUF342 family protein
MNEETYIRKLSELDKEYWSKRSALTQEFRDLRKQRYELISQIIQSLLPRKGDPARRQRLESKRRMKEISEELGNYGSSLETRSDRKTSESGRNFIDTQRDYEGFAE